MENEKPDLVSPWHPMSSAVDKKHIGKLLEELGELTAAASRCLIQGIDEREPITGKPNYEWLMEEIADVQANLELCIENFSLSRTFIATRKARKIVKLREWHKMA